jgi:hypothetical protein
LALIREAIELHIGDLRQSGQQVPPPSSSGEVIEIAAAGPLGTVSANHENTTTKTRKHEKVSAYRCGALLARRSAITSTATSMTSMRRLKQTWDPTRVSSQEFVAELAARGWPRTGPPRRARPSTGSGRPELVVLRRCSGRP